MIAISMNSTSNWQACLKEHEAAVVRLSMYPVWVSTRRNRSLPRSDPRPHLPVCRPTVLRVGTCPGREESAEQSKSNRSLRRILDQAANAAVKTKGSLFQALYRRIRGSDQKKQNLAIWAVANRLCRIVWKMLHQGVRYEERASQPNRKAIKDRA